MGIGQKLQGIFAKGVSASKDLATKGALKIESARLKSQMEKLFAKLGLETYNRLVDMDKATLSRESPLVGGLLEELKAIHRKIDTREREYLAVGTEIAQKA